MRPLVFFVFLSFFNHFSYSQEFKFQLNLKDASGKMDSLIFGFDSNATDSVDTQFQENNIKSNPYKSIFEARIGNMDYSEHDQYSADFTSFHSKIQIVEKDCGVRNFPYISVICLNEVQFPIELTWQQTLFQDSCVNQSLVTDWHPGGWFDAAYGGEQYPVYLKDQNTAIFTHTTHGFIQENGDTTNKLFLTLASDKHKITSIAEVDTKFFVVYPNPANDFITIKSDYPIPNNTKVILFNSLGQKVKTIEEIDKIDLSNLTDGLYFIKLTDEKNFATTKSIIKNTHANSSYK